MDSMRFNSRLTGAGGGDWERTEAATGHGRTAEGDEDEDKLTVITPGNGPSFFAWTWRGPNGQMELPVVQVRKKILSKKKLLTKE
jgi:hypothetical protein